MIPTTNPESSPANSSMAAGPWYATLRKKGRASTDQVGKSPEDHVARTGAHEHDVDASLMGVLTNEFAILLQRAESVAVPTVFVFGTRRCDAMCHVCILRISEDELIGTRMRSQFRQLRVKRLLCHRVTSRSDGTSG